MELKHGSGRVLGTKQATRNGVPIGIVSGYIATWDRDEQGDRFVRGAFLDSLAEHRRRGDRPIRLKDHHARTLGGFPIDTVREDARGLYAVGEVNLETQQGREAFALARQGVLSDFSIGFTSLEDRLSDGGRTREIVRARVWEGSIVDEPANPAARVLQVKGRDRLLGAVLADLAATKRHVRGW